MPSASAKPGGIELEDARGGRCRAEAAARAGRVPAQIVVRAISAGAFQHARGKVVAGEQSHEGVAARHAAAPRQRHHHRHDDGTRMAAAAEIVELERMRGRAVDERGLRRRQAYRCGPTARRCRSCSRFPRARRRWRSRRRRCAQPAMPAASVSSRKRLARRTASGVHILISRRRPIVGGALDQRSALLRRARCQRSSLRQPYLVPPLIDSRPSIDCATARRRRRSGPADGSSRTGGRAPAPPAP